MKTLHLPTFAAAAFTLAALAVSGCSGKDQTDSTALPSAKSVSSAVTPTTTPASPLVNPPGTITSAETGAADWAALKGYTFDQRTTLLAALPQMTAKADAQLAELTAKVTPPKPGTDTSVGDAALKEVQEARAQLKDTSEALNSATIDTWETAKDKVGQAWTRTQTAYAKAKSLPNA